MQPPCNPHATMMHARSPSPPFLPFLPAVGTHLPVVCTAGIAAPPSLPPPPTTGESVVGRRVGAVHTRITKTHLSAPTGSWINGECAVGGVDAVGPCAAPCGVDAIAPMQPPCNPHATMMHARSPSPPFLPFLPAVGTHLPVVCTAGIAAPPSLPPPPTTGESVVGRRVGAVHTRVRVERVCGE